MSGTFIHRRLFGPRLNEFGIWRAWRAWPAIHKAFLALLFLATLGTANPAFAWDSTLAPPPQPQPIDRNFKNLSTGYWDWYGPSISIGTPGQGGLSYQTYKGEGTNGGWANDASWVSSVKVLDPILNDHHVWATLRGQVEEFTDNGGGSYTPTNGTGGTLTKSGSVWTYTNAQGVAAVFTHYSFSCNYYCTDALANTVTYPTGEVQSYTWRTQTYYFYLQSVTNNFGYQIKVNFDCSTPTNAACYVQADSVMAINNAVEYCDPTATSCSPSNSWPILTFDYGASEGVTDALSHRWYNTGTSSYNSGTGTWTIEYVHYTPTGQYLQYDWSCSGGCMAEPYPETVTDGTDTWSYNFYIDSFSNFIADVYDGNTREVTSSGGQVLSDMRDPSGINTGNSWTYNANGSYATVGFPNTDSWWFSYDGRGNQTDNYGYGQRPYHLQADFPASCTYQVNCNKPDYTTDADGNVTTYTYDNTYGVLLTAEGPGMGGGVHSLTTYSYTSEYAWYKNSGGTIVQAATPIYLLTGTSTCMSSTNSCSGTADERKTVVAYEVGSSGTASNLNVVTSTIEAGDASAVATTTNTYDMYGNVGTTTDPNFNTTAFFYDLDRRRVGTVLPDPDGGGALLNPATKTTYDDSGRVLEVEQGTTPSQTQYDFDNNFTSLAQASTAYDANTGLKVQDSAAIGGTTVSVTQYSYYTNYGATLPKCTAVRENAAVFGSLPDACSHSTVGSYGYDPISQNNYDAANRLISVYQGVDSGTQITSLTNDFDGFGRLDWVEDAHGNRTGYVYDGNNRLYQMLMPDPSTAHTTNPYDYEQYGYDNQANMTTKQLRSGDIFTYDFDPVNRVYHREDPISSTNDIYYGYDLVGDPLYAHYGSSGGSGVDYTWDALGRKITESSYGHTITSAYDAAGNRTCLKYPDGQYILYTYDPLNRMQNVQQGTASNCSTSSPTTLATYAYDDLGRGVGIGSRPNGTTTSASYNSTSQSWSVSQDLASTGQDVTLSMDYTPGAQLTTRGINNSSYRYTVPSSSTTPYCPNGLNQYAMVGGSGGSCSGGATYSYDTRGNLTSDGSRTFTYDLDNELTQATNGTAGTPTNWNAANWNAFQWSGTATSYFQYDPEGRLHQTDTPSGHEQYLYDGDALVMEYDNSGSTILRRYVPGAGVDETLVWYEGSNLSTPNWLHTDEQGSFIAASDGSGVGTLYVYGPAGEPQGGFSAGAPIFRYTGQAQMAAIGLYYYKARMYDPNLGRFLQTDPAGLSAGMNLYAYVMNNFANATDSNGMGCTKKSMASNPDDGIDTVVVTGQCSNDPCEDTLVCYGDASIPSMTLLELLVVRSKKNPPAPLRGANGPSKGNICPAGPLHTASQWLADKGSIVARAGAGTAALGLIVDAVLTPPTWVSGTTGILVGGVVDTIGLGMQALGTYGLQFSGDRRAASQTALSAALGYKEPDILAFAPKDPADTIANSLTNYLFGPQTCP